MFQIKVVEKIKTHFCSIVFYCQESCRLWDRVEKYCTGRPQMKKMPHAHCMLDI